ncbi:RHS repeat-associated core domain-containing protein [Facilibium subflavum]|uniref:RHS repeat-associated core domain-containing protein n=1 Tax=Facilibium subflavum TaxID=2219058 RepID=UPI000E64F8E0|nr:RHS repeat-associated core domain-containing protein [Facilibium subflavum]
MRLYIELIFLLLLMLVAQGYAQAASSIYYFSDGKSNIAVEHLSKKGIKGMNYNAYGKAYDKHTFFGYNQEYWDNFSLSVYLRARSYKPDTQHFLSRDSFPVWNKYNFANANPVLNIDPSGHMSAVVKWSIIGGAIVGATLAGFAALRYRPASYQETVKEMLTIEDDKGTLHDALEQYKKDVKRMSSRQYQRVNDQNLEGISDKEMAFVNQGMARVTWVLAEQKSDHLLIDASMLYDGEKAYAIFSFMSDDGKMIGGEIESLSSELGDSRFEGISIKEKIRFLKKVARKRKIGFSEMELLDANGEKDQSQSAYIRFSYTLKVSIVDYSRSQLGYYWGKFANFWR